MQTIRNNAPNPNGWEVAKALIIGFFILIAFGLAGKHDQEREQTEAQVTQQILLDNGIITK
jgi:hypothetical protein